MDERATELKTAQNEKSKSAQAHRHVVLKEVTNRLSEIEGDGSVNGAIVRIR